MKKFFNGLYRLRWPVGLSLGLIVLLDYAPVDPMSRWVLVMYKTSVATFACLIADLITWSIFPLFDLQKYLDGKDAASKDMVARIYQARCLVLAALILGI